VSLKVVISGAGIAGLALAHWLERVGASALIVERAPCFQALGHYISLKGNGVEMLRRMGLLEACRERSAPLDETRMYDRRGRLLRTEGSAALNQMLGGYLLLRRADLQAALHELVRERAEIRFGVEITAARLDERGVTLQLGDGRSESADLLIGADGLHSRVRGLVFGDGFERPLGGYYIAFTQALRHGLPLATHSYWGRGQMVSLYAVAESSVSSVVYTDDAAGAPPRHDARALRDYLLATSAGFPDHVRRIISEIGADDFVFSDRIVQVDVPSIARGRCALVGDAAHCPTFLSGMGSSLAMQDALLLAGALARDPDDVGAALRAYADAAEPIARRYRASARAMRRLVLGRNPVTVYARNQLLRWLPERSFERRARAFIDAERPIAEL
jgi:2-polyprenyl-6-methoxyphenol hydroxylase-like FAD-dependent oxidoreductase